MWREDQLKRRGIILFRGGAYSLIQKVNLKEETYKRSKIYAQELKTWEGPQWEWPMGPPPSHTMGTAILRTSRQLVGSKEYSRIYSHRIDLGINEPFPSHCLLFKPLTGRTWQRFHQHMQGQCQERFPPHLLFSDSKIKQVILACVGSLQYWNTGTTE